MARRGFRDYLKAAGLGDDHSRSRRVRDGFWQVVAHAAKRLPMLDEVVAAYYCALDPQTPARVRGTLLAALAYFVLPVDAIPDFILGLGFTDDAAVLAAAIGAVSGHIAPAHRRAARVSLGRPT